ncbi:MAG: butyrate kinase [Lachnospiraceae bacterium]|nr:butyrate kinase [Lachnospiraceae bacterium]
MERILVINPGSTSFKLAVFEDREKKVEKNITYTAEQMASFASFEDQYDMRRQTVFDFLKDTGYAPEDITAVAARGSGFGPMESGAYVIDEALEKACHTNVRHASFLATVIGYEFVKTYGIPGFVYDCQSAVTMEPYVQMTGLPELQRRAGGHVLNSRAAARKAAEKAGKRYEDGVYIVAHLGGGCTTSLHNCGRIIDVIGGEEGTFSPERAGGLPMRGFTKLCFSGKYTQREVAAFFTGTGGFVAHLGTNDAREVARRMREGDEKALMVCRGMGYRISRDIGALFAVAGPQVDGIVLTGGLAYFEELMSMVVERVKKLAPVTVLPGTFEMEALAFGVLRVLSGEEEARRL